MLAIEIRNKANQATEIRDLYRFTVNDTDTTHCFGSTGTGIVPFRVNGMQLYIRSQSQP